MASPQPAPAALPRLSFAGLVRRLAAYFLDVLIHSPVIFIVSFTLRGLRALGLWIPAAGEQPPDVMWRGLGVGAKLSIVFGFMLSMGPIYLALFEASPWQASFGKRILGICVSDNQGKRISVARALGRSTAKFFSLLWFPLGLLSMFTISTSKKEKALHDFVAGTIVVRGRPAAGGSFEPWRIVAAFGIPFVWILGTFLTTL